MILTGPWKINDFKKANVNFGITSVPVFPGQTTPPATFSGVRLAFVSAYTEHPKEAADFAKYLVSKSVLEKRFTLTQQTPPRKDITVNDPLSNGILAQAKFATPMPTIPQMGTYWSAMGAAYASIWDGEEVQKELNSARFRDAVREVVFS
jgi:arabinogalactan oligomer/maltooligosaccharide transport system substrate-binding protein